MKSSTMVFASWRTAKAGHSTDQPETGTTAATVFGSWWMLFAALPVRSCVVDGEAIAVDENGLSVFDLLHYRRKDDGWCVAAARLFP